MANRESLPLFIDPDFRRNPPMDGTPYCVRCQKPISDTRQAIAVTLDDEGLNVVKMDGRDYIGADCWRQIQKASHAR